MYEAVSKNLIMFLKIPLFFKNKRAQRALERSPETEDF